MPCHSLPYLDLSHWREEVTQCRVNGLDIELGSSRKISPCTSCTCTKEGVSEIFKLAKSISGDCLDQQKNALAYNSIAMVVL